MGQSQVPNNSYCNCDRSRSSSLFQQLTLSNRIPSPLRYRAYPEPPTQNIVGEYKPHGHRWALNHCWRGRPVSAAPLQSWSLTEYFNDFDDIFLFRLLESTSPLPQSIRNCTGNKSHKHSTVVHDLGAVADVSRLEGLLKDCSIQPVYCSQLYRIHQTQEHSKNSAANCRAKNVRIILW